MTKELRDLKPISSKLGPSLSIFTTASDVFNPVTDLITNTSTPAVTIVPWDVTEFNEPENFTHCYDEVVACPTSTTKVTLKNITTTLMTVIFANITNFTSTPPFDELSTFHSFTQSTNDSFEFHIEDLNNTMFTESSNLSQSTMYQYTQSPTANMTDMAENVTSTYGDNDADYVNYVDESDTDYESLFLDDPFAIQSGNKNLSELSSTHGYSTSLIDEELKSSSRSDSTESSEYLIRENNRPFIRTTEIQLETSGGTDSQYTQYTTQVPTTNELCYITKCIILQTADYGYPFGTEQSKIMSAKASDDYMDRDIMPVFSALIEQKYNFVNASSTDLNTTIRKKLRSLCWETMFGQELVKLTMMDLVRNTCYP